VRGARIIERVLAAIPTMFGIAVIVFLFMRLSPGDPVDIMLGESGAVSEAEVQALREEFNLDEPLHVQLYIFLKRAVMLDLGRSITTGAPVTDLILETLPATVELALAAMTFALVVAIPVALIAAVKQYSLIDRLSMGAAFLGISMPAFWLGIALMIVFSVNLGWLPTSGRLASDLDIAAVTGLYVVDSLIAGDWACLVNALQHLVLPAVSLGAAMAAIVARVLRSSMLEVLRQDYVMLGRAKGLSELTVVGKHALRNALIPTVTVVGLQTGVLLGGNMVVETVFGWPGLGRLAVDAIFSRDYPLVQGVVMVYAATFVAANLLVDVLYTWLNPRITL